MQTLAEKEVLRLEYRFRGTLGFGGKIKQNGSGGVPYVDCYSEDLTPERQATIKATNAALAEIFAKSNAPHAGL